MVMSLWPRFLAHPIDRQTDGHRHRAIADTSLAWRRASGNEGGWIWVTKLTQGHLRC